MMKLHSSPARARRAIHALLLLATCLLSSACSWLTGEFSTADLRQPPGRAQIEAESTSTSATRP